MFRLLHKLHQLQHKSIHSDLIIIKNIHFWTCTSHFIQSTAHTIQTSHLRPSDNLTPSHLSDLLSYQTTDSFYIRLHSHTLHIFKTHVFQLSKDRTVVTLLTPLLCLQCLESISVDQTEHSNSTVNVVKVIYSMYRICICIS